MGTRSEGLARWSLRLLGGFELKALPGGEEVVPPGKRERVLLAYLALSPKGRRERRKLVTLLWGDDADAATLDNLRTCVWNLRKALGDTEHRLISSEGRDIVLNADAFDVDVLAFCRLAAQSGIAEMEAAGSLYAGDFLEGLSIESEEFESWRREEATRCKDQALKVLTRLMTQLTEAGETDRAIAAGTRILRLEPLHEPTVRGLMRLYAESGRRGTAVQLYRTLAEALRKELGAQPAAETRAVFAEISRGADERPPVAATAAKAKAPHPVDIAHPSASPRESLPAAPQNVNVRTLGWMTAGGLAAAAIVLFLFYQLSPPADTTGLQPRAVVETKEIATIAIAVLPFVNLSGEASQDFFSDGMTEEITSALARVPGLTVLARTSAFEFKGQSRDIRAIGRALGARYLIEGSVRKAGDRVRISAQLVQADDGAHVWAESYDRQLTDVFRTQEEIARAIAASLRMPLGLTPSGTLVSYRPADQDTYDLYLRARAAVRDRKGAEALQLMDQVVARDPNFGPGWVWLARARNIVGLNRAFAGEKSEISYPESHETLARRAIELAPGYIGGYVLLATQAQREGRWLEAAEGYKQALARDPDDPDVLFTYGNHLLMAGYLKEALAAYERAHMLEPLVRVYNKFRAETLAATGEIETAVSEFLRAGGGNVPGDFQLLAPAYARLGRFDEAIDALVRAGARTTFTSGPYTKPLFEAAAEVLRAAANKSAPPSRLPDFESELAFVYAYTSTPERMLDRPEKAVKAGGPFSWGVLRDWWWLAPSSVRKTERFKALARDVGVVDVWRARGWPDLCRPVGADFVCD